MYTVHHQLCSDETLTTVFKTSSAMAITVAKTVKLVNDVLKYIEERVTMTDDLRDVMAQCRTDMTPKRKKRVVVKKSENHGQRRRVDGIPLRALTIANLFVQDKMAQLKAAGVGTDPILGNVLKQATTSWNNLSDEARQNYKETNAERLVLVNIDRKRGIRAAANACAVESL